MDIIYTSQSVQSGSPPKPLKRNFILVSHDEIIIHFKNLTKTTKLSPFDQRTLVVIHQPYQMIGICHYISLLSPSQKLTAWDTPEISMFMQRITGVSYTGHSIKRGALLHLSELITPDLLPYVPILAKHSTISMIPATTIRYFSHNLIPMARLLGTQKLTIFL